jgi:hypothetical protein
LERILKLKIIHLNKGIVMMKFVKHHMESIDGVSIYPIISLIICFTFFALLFWWVFSYKKKDLNEISNIPLNEDDNNNNIL